MDAISGTTFVSDSVKFLRDSLRTNITDPISSKRGSGSSFVMTSFPQKDVTYPMITVKSAGPYTNKKLGMQSEQEWINLPFEVRIWARNVKERDALTEQVHNFLLKNQIGTGSETNNFGIYDFRLTSNIPIDDVDENGKDTGIRSQQMNYTWKTII